MANYKKRDVSLTILVKQIALFSVTPKQNQSSCMNMPVLFDAKPLKCVNVIKFLVIFIDENHSWKFLIDHVCSQISNWTVWEYL